MIPTPLTKTNDLIKDLGSIFDSGTRLDEFSVRRYQQEISAIYKISPAEGMSLDGFIAGINNNPNEVIQLAKKYLAEPTADSDVYINFAIILRGLNKTVDAYAVLLDGYQKFPLAVNLVREIAYYAIAFDDQGTIETLKEKFPEEFHAIFLLYATDGDGLTDEQVISSIDSIPNSFEETPLFTPRELQNLKTLLDGVE